MIQFINMVHHDLMHHIVALFLYVPEARSYEGRMK